MTPSDVPGLVSTEEQIRRLRLVSATAVILVRPGDAVAMVIKQTPKRTTELCSPVPNDETYDVWLNGNLKRSSLTLDQARTLLP